MSARPRPQEEALPRWLILRTMLATVMIGVSLCFAAYLVMRGWMLSVRPSYRFPERELPAPHEVANVRQEPFRMPWRRPDVVDEQHAVLGSFGWVDRSRGIVRIPVEAAMDLIARGQ